MYSIKIIKVIFYNVNCILIYNNIINDYVFYNINISL